MKKRIFFILVLVAGLLGILVVGSKKVTHELIEGVEKSVNWVEHLHDETIDQVKLDVPLESQFEGDELGNGCEVTALSMLLRYYGYDTNKNELANQLDYQPLYTESGLHGNPHEGFVGDITGGDEAMGVMVEPIAKLAKQYVSDKYQVKASDNKKSFSEIMDIVSQKTPVWIIATIDFEVPQDDDFMLWDTDEGNIYVTGMTHSAVITGFDREKQLVYVNDPYGKKNRAVDWDTLKEVYDQMNRQALYLVAK